MTVAILSVNLRATRLWLRSDHGALLRDTEGLLGDGRPFRIYTSPERLCGARITDFLVGPAYDANIHGIRVLAEMEEMARHLVDRYRK